MCVFLLTPHNILVDFPLVILAHFKASDFDLDLISQMNPVEVAYDRYIECLASVSAMSTTVMFSLNKSKIIRVLARMEVLRHQSVLIENLISVINQDLNEILPIEILDSEIMERDIKFSRGDGQSSGLVKSICLSL